MKLVVVPHISSQILIARGMDHALASEIGIHSAQFAHFAHTLMSKSAEPFTRCLSYQLRQATLILLRRAHRNYLRHIL